MRTDNFKSQSYFRLLKYVKPYKTRLVIGIICGMMTGGFFGASFFWLKGFVQPFETQSAPSFVKSRNDKAAAPAKTVSSSDVPNVKDNLGDSFMKEARKNTDQLDNVVSIASRFGIHLTNEEGKMTLFGLILFVASFVIVWLLKNVTTYLNNYCMRWVGSKVVNDMRNDIFNKVMDQSLVFYGKADVGQLISRCVGDPGQIQAGVSDMIADMTTCPFQVLGSAGFIIFVSIVSHNTGLLVIMIVGSLLIMAPIIIIGRKVKTVYRRAYQRIAEVTSRIHEVFSGIMLVKAYNTEDHEKKVFEKVNRTYFRTTLKGTRAELLMTPLTEFVGVTAIAAFFLYCFINHVMLSDIVILVTPAVLAYRPLKDLVKVNNTLQKCMAATDRYFDLLDTDTSLKEIPNPKRISEFKDSIIFENVHFSYGDGGNEILNGINFKLGKGKMVAVVGETGSGKTTIANLLARFYDTSSGHVLMDGVDIRDLKISDIRDLIGIVTQNAILFNDTIANNIAYGCPGTPIEKIIEAAKKANAHDFITGGNHEQGYDTVVGEKGFLLSGGEKQRIAIARAILRNPPILILDEATSALDTVTEKLVQDALNNLMGSRTVFAIAHRLSTIKHADTILVLDKGKIIESGTHEELLAKEGGRYKNLHNIQFDL